MTNVIIQVIFSDAFLALIATEIRKKTYNRGWDFQLTYEIFFLQQYSVNLPVMFAGEQNIKWLVTKEL